MTYPIIENAEARAYLQSLKTENSLDFPTTRTVDEGADHDWHSLGGDLLAKLESLAVGGPVKKRGDPRGAEFEISAAPIVHERLPSDPALADPRFWTWLTMTFGLGLVNWRYENKPDLANFGAGSPVENLMFRIWLRAEVAYSPELSDPYELAKVGDIDFWRSHIFRQSYADSRTFARALINFQFPQANQRKAKLSINDIRALVKRLKKARTNLHFELMPYDRASRFIQEEWERLASPT